MHELIKHWATCIAKILELTDRDIDIGVVEDGSGSMAMGGRRIIFDTTQVRTTRDVIFILGHEMTHLKQRTDNPGILSEGITFGRDMNPREYRALPREREADQVAVYLTRTLEYKNEVLNRDVPSMFVQCLTETPE